ncbi:MAG: hypothetical protein ACO3JF_04160 [Ilumatobacteraceae bacterium]
MFFWFLGTSFIAVWFVFRDDRFDYRVLALGALLPDVVDILSGGVWVMHSVVASVLVLGVVMAGARRGSVRRRRWLALPIGMLLHLVFDGAFNSTEAFWWPFAGHNFVDESIPSLNRMSLNIVLEVVGLAMLAWMWKINEMSVRANRLRFISTGRLVGATSTDVGQC